MPLLSLDLVFRSRRAHSENILNCVENSSTSTISIFGIVLLFFVPSNTLLYELILFYLILVSIYFHFFNVSIFNIDLICFIEPNKLQKWRFWSLILNLRILTHIIWLQWNRHMKWLIDLFILLVESTSVYVLVEAIKLWVISCLFGHYILQNYESPWNDNKLSKFCLSNNFIIAKWYQIVDLSQSIAKSFNFEYKWSVTNHFKIAM